MTLGQQPYWQELIGSIGNFLVLSMAKNHLNLPVSKAKGRYYYGVDHLIHGLFWGHYL